MRDAGDDTAEQPPVVSNGLLRDACSVMRDGCGLDTRHSTLAPDRPEAERVERADWPGAHGEDVADDSPHTRGRALKWLDGAGMIVGFDFKGDGQSIANVDNARVFLPCADEDFAGFGGERFEQRPRVFV